MTLSGVASWLLFTSGWLRVRSLSAYVRPRISMNWALKSTATVVVVEVDSVVGVLDEFPPPQPANSNAAIDTAKIPAKVFDMERS